MKITFLGTGTSQGIPLIGCACAVCSDSKNPGSKNNRKRVSITVERDGKTILIDTSQDFKQQMLDYVVERIDAILYTHSHADHIYGLPDIRTYNFRQKDAIPCYGMKQTLDDIKRSFSYMFTPPKQIGGGIPKLTLHPISEAFDVFGKQVVPIPVKHGVFDVVGYRFDSFAYVTDVNHIPESSKALLQGLDVLVLGALRHKPHVSHFSIDEAIAMVQELAPKKAYFTHMEHLVDHYTTVLPEGIEFAYDGLTITL